MARVAEAKSLPEPSRTEGRAREREEEEEEEGQGRAREGGSKGQQYVMKTNPRGVQSLCHKRHGSLLYSLSSTCLPSLPLARPSFYSCSLCTLTYPRPLLSPLSLSLPTCLGQHPPPLPPLPACGDISGLPPKHGRVKRCLLHSLSYLVSLPLWNYATL